jgi:hypothetical protein
VDNKVDQEEEAKGNNSGCIDQGGQVLLSCGLYSDRYGASVECWKPWRRGAPFNPKLQTFIVFDL